MHTTTPTSRRFWFVLPAALAIAMLLGPNPAAAQGATPSGSSAWWARFTDVDDAVGCAAEQAWLGALDVEQRDAQQGTTDQLADVTTGPELLREQQHLSEAAPQTERQWVRYANWTVIGGNSEEVVIYAAHLIRAGPADATGTEKEDAESVESLQVAYRMVLENGAWRLADRHVFEQGHHAVDADLGHAVRERYQQLLSGLAAAYNARDADALESVLDGPALEQYRTELQQLEDQQDNRTVQLSGNLELIDVQTSDAVLAFQGMRTYTHSDSASAAESGVQTEEPVTLVHRLELRNGDWKIVDEFRTSTHRDADGTEHVEGCA